MKYDIVIKNGTVIDPLKHTSEKKDVFIYQEKIVEGCENYEAAQVIDAEGYYVTPGIIENHCHLYYGAADSGLKGDLFLLPNGVTSAIDQGTAGVENFEHFYRSCVCQTMLNTKAYLNVAGMGMPLEGTFENIDPKSFNKDKIKFTLEKYKDTILGLKLRICSDNEKDLGLAPLEKTMELATELNCQVSVHVKTPKFEYKEYAPFFRKGDVWVHMYNVKGHNCINPLTDEVYDELIEAQNRGVMFDVASGRSGFSFDIIKKAFKRGFKPNILGTDLVTFNIYQRPMFSLLYTMSLYMSLGYSFEDVLDLTVVKTAKTMHDETLATLAENTIADIAILENREGPIEFKDRYGGSNMGNNLLVPKCTIKSGKIVYRSIDF